jgi:Protein of unknown function (DUF3309)
VAAFVHISELEVVAMMWAARGAQAASRSSHRRELVLRTGGVAMLTILIVLVIVLALGAAPAWPYSRGWGYYPSGTLGLVLLILIVLALTGRL